MTDRDIISLHRSWWRGDLAYRDYVDRLGDVDLDHYERLLRRETVRELAPGVLLTVAMIILVAGAITGGPPIGDICAWALVPVAWLGGLWSGRELTRCVLIGRELRAWRDGHGGTDR
jgi:hypothetical protein